MSSDGNSVGLAAAGGSLTEIGDVLYLDQPVGTGFSFGQTDSDVLTSMDDIASEFINFLSTFLNMYPEYKQPRKVILMGEDFAGKYIPRFAKEIDSFVAKGGALKL